MPGGRRHIPARRGLYNEGKLDIGATFEEYLEKRFPDEKPEEKWLEHIREGYNLYKEKGLHGDMVRLELMRRFGYYITESSEHNSEYMPYFIKSKYPELIERFNIPLDEYPRRCVRQIADWEARRDELLASIFCCIYLRHIKTTLRLKSSSWKITTPCARRACARYSSR